MKPKCILKSNGCYEGRPTECCEQHISVGQTAWRGQGGSTENMKKISWDLKDEKVLASQRPGRECSRQRKIMHKGPWVDQSWCNWKAKSSPMGLEHKVKRWGRTDLEGLSCLSHLDSGAHPFSTVHHWLRPVTKGHINKCVLKYMKKLCFYKENNEGQETLGRGTQWKVLKRGLNFRKIFHSSFRKVFWSRRQVHDSRWQRGLREQRVGGTRFSQMQGLDLQDEAIVERW